MFTLPHGTQVETRDGHPTRASDPSGTPLWQIRWQGVDVESVRLWRPDRSEFVVKAGTTSHPLFGRSDAIGVPGEATPLALVAATRWTNPRWIPPVDRPGALPTGVGSALLNMLATCARYRGQHALRYRGPYPTSALFESLCWSFDAQPDEATARDQFVANVENRALVGRMEEVDVAFAPAPHEWCFFGPRVCVQRRRGVERVYIDGTSYPGRATAGAPCLRRTGSGWTASVVIAGAVWHDVLAFDPQGVPLGEPIGLPSAPHPLDGTPLPDGLGPLLGTLLAERAPKLLGPAIESVMGTYTLAWGATGLALAQVPSAPDRILLHSTLGDRLLAKAPTEMLDHLVAALEPLVRRLAQHRLAEAHAAASPD